MRVLRSPGAGEPTRAIGTLFAYSVACCSESLPFALMRGFLFSLETTARVCLRNFFNRKRIVVCKDIPYHVVNWAYNLFHQVLHIFFKSKIKFLYGPSIKNK